MITDLKQSLWRQFGASIDMLENVIDRCTDEFFSSNRKFFYLTYHSLIFLDYYMTIPPGDFSPLLPFTIKEPAEIPEDAMGDVVPDRFYTKAELLDYLNASREKGYRLITSLTEEKLKERFIEELEPDAMDYSLLEILLYNMRHVQHHVGQLNMLLRQWNLEVPKWVFRAQDDFTDDKI